MSWNYRVIRRKHEGVYPCYVYGFHEVYYKKDVIKGWSEEPQAPFATSDDETTLEDALKDLKITLNHMQEALTKPVLEEIGKKLVEVTKDIPDREKWLYENPKALKAVLNGLEQSKRGEGEYLGDFSDEEA